MAFNIFDIFKKTPEPIATTVKKRDSFINPLTGIGLSAFDKRLSAYYQTDRLLSESELEDAFHGNDIAARICEIGPEEMLRQGFELSVGSNESDQNRKITSDIMSICTDLCVKEKFTDAAVWANVFGGSALFVGALDGNNPEEPLAENNIEAVRFLTGMDKRDLMPASWYSDPLHPNYGRPSTYRIIPASITGEVYRFANAEIHESRLIIFQGTRTSLRKRQALFGWGLSLLQRVWEVLQDFNQTWGSLSNLMQDASQGIFKIKDLAQLVAEDNNNTDLKLAQRVQGVDMARGMGRSIMVDAEFEDFRRETANLAGMSDMMDKFIMRLCSAAKVPASILMGKQPSGALTTSLDSEMRWFYDNIKAQQVNSLKPKLTRLIKLIMLSREGPTQGKLLDFEVSFPPLWQSNETEEGKMRLAIAQADVAYITAGVLLPEEVAISRFRPEGFSMETIIDAGSRVQELTFQKNKPVGVNLSPTQAPITEQPTPPATNPQQKGLP